MHDIIKHVKRIFIIVIGLTILLFGILLLVLPGPGIIIILLALAILATELIWAKRILKKIKDTAKRT